MSTSLVLVTVTALSVAGLKAVANDGRVVIRGPMIYYIDYTDEYFTDEAYAERFRAAPPDVVHVGKAVPITHHWGPVPVMRGENQYTGGPGHTLNRAAIRLLTPDELRQKTEVIKAGVRRLHEVGVREVMPYIAYQTIAGDHQTREGFWHFYDRWSEYEAWLGPRPPDDPFTWLMCDAQGKFLPGQCGGYSPDYYAPLHRYRVCSNNEHWMGFLKTLVRLVAECGYDGVFVDNVGPGGDQCRYCQERFRKWLAGRFSSEELQKVCAGKPLEQVRVEDPTLPAELVRRFRIEVVRDDLASLRAAGEAVRPGFKVFPNSGLASSVLPVSDGCDLYMWESVYSPGRPEPGPPPSSRRVSVTVGDSGEPAGSRAFALDLSWPALFVDLKAKLLLPVWAEIGKPCVFTLSIEQVGSSHLDDDAIRNIRLELHRVGSDETVAASFQPATPIGGPAYKGARRPPVELRAVWTPEREGEWGLTFCCEYNDTSHQDTTKDLAMSVPLLWSGAYRTHIDTLLFTLPARSRMVFLDYEARRPGMEKALELWLAECAAFGNGAAVASLGKSLEKYHRFFRRYPSLWEGVRPYAQAGVLYSFWGPNAIASRGMASEASMAEILSSEHCLITSMTDRDLSAGWLSGLEVVYLSAESYEMPGEALAALREFVQRGGKLVLGSQSVTVNGQPVSTELGIGTMAAKLGTGQITLWDPAAPVLPSRPVAPTGGPLAGLRFAAYHADGPPERIILHAVNYNVGLADKPVQVTPVGPITLRLPVPHDWPRVQAKAFDPDVADVATLDVRVAEGVAQFDLPQVDLYKVIELTGHG